MAQSKFVTFMRDLLNITEYESEATRYMREFMAQHPEELESQKKGRGVWWDKDARERTAPAEARHSPKSGGAEYTFKA
jgi:hypothetical protein